MCATQIKIKLLYRVTNQLYVFTWVCNLLIESLKLNVTIQMWIMYVFCFCKLPLVIVYPEVIYQTVNKYMFYSAVFCVDSTTSANFRHLEVKIWVKMVHFMEVMAISTFCAISHTKHCSVLHMHRECELNVWILLYQNNFSNI